MAGLAAAIDTPLRPLYRVMAAGDERLRLEKVMAAGEARFAAGEERLKTTLGSQAGKP